MSASLDCATILAADMRQLADDIAAGRAIVGQSVWQSYADRVEKIGTGNIAKLRNALELSKVAILVAKEKMDLENPVILEIIDEALAAPERNCDKAKVWQDLYTNFRAPEGMREMPPEWVDAIISFCGWIMASEQKLDPKIKYSVTNFKLTADFGAASTRGGQDCMSCKNALGHTKCGHPCLARPFSLGVHFDRVGCRNGWEAK